MFNLFGSGFGVGKIATPSFKSASKLTGDVKTGLAVGMATEKVVTAAAKACGAKKETAEAVGAAAGIVVGGVVTY